MTASEKVINRCKRICYKEIEKLKEKYTEVEGNYRDRGWERDYRSMERLEDEINKIECFVDGTSIWRDDAMAKKHKIEKWETQINIIRNITREIANEPFTSPAIRQLIREVDKF